MVRDPTERMNHKKDFKLSDDFCGLLLTIKPRLKGFDSACDGLVALSCIINFPQ
jgi:hypothetical protein